MINMMKADFYRIFRGIGIYIGIAIMLLIIGISVYVIEPGSLGATTTAYESSSESYSTPMNDMTYDEIQNFSMTEYRKAMLKTDGFELDKALLANNMNLYYVFIFVAALAVAVDFSGGSVKNTLSSAISKRKYFISKFLFTTLVCLLIFFANTYLAHFAIIIFDNEKFVTSLGMVTKVSLTQLPAILALISILNGIAFIAKKTSIFNTISIPLVMVFQFLMGAAVSIFNIDSKYTQYEFQTMLSRLANNPSHSYMVNSYIICAVVIVVSTAIGYLSFRKSEIK
jgi:ABC-type transport system involved in multi-copper enzyme maturation permease subunit